MIPGKKYAPEDFLAIAWRRKWIIIVPLVLASVASFIYSRMLPNRYKSEALVLVIPQQVPENMVRSTIEEKLSRRLDLMRQQILSRARLERIIEEFDLYEEQRKVLLMDQVIEIMRKDISIAVQKVNRKEDPNHFTVSYESESARDAVRVAERLASLFVRENLEGRNVQTDATVQWLQSQVDEALRRLQEHDARLAEFKRAQGGRLPDEVATNVTLLQGARQQIQTLNDAIRADRERQHTLERLISEEMTLGPLVSAPRSGGPAQSGQPQSAAQKLAETRATLDSLLLRFKEDHPDVRLARSRIRDLEQKAEAEALQQPLAGGAPGYLTPTEAERQRRLSQYRGELESLGREIKAKQAGIQRAQAAVQQYELGIQAAPGVQSQMADLMRDYGTLRSTYDTLLKKLQDAKLSATLEARQVSQQFRIIDPARRPDRPHSPDRVRMNIIGALMGLGLGVAIVGLLEYRDTSLRTSDDVLVALSLPVLAMVPTMRTVADGRQRRRRRFLLVGSSAAAMLLMLAAAVVWKLRLHEMWGR